MSILVLNYIVFLLSSFVMAQNSFNSDEFISLINSQQNSWKAGRNFHKDMPLENAMNLIGPWLELIPNHTVNIHDDKLISGLPKNFDPREKWPDCQSLNEIRDQGQCGSGWAYAAVEVMTDRMCIYSNGNQNFFFSAEDLLTCCGTDCGGERLCDGGSLYGAWMYWKTKGIVSGGAYNTSQGCKNSAFPPCEISVDGHMMMCPDRIKRLECVQKCETGYNVDYTLDKHRGKTVYLIKGEDNMKAELYMNGPIESVMSVYEDFFNYKSGVYTQTAGVYLGPHGIKILGWGIENGIRYWLCANSWNSNWGDKGFFKILRGENHVGIEGVSLAGEPHVEKIIMRKENNTVNHASKTTLDQYYITRFIGTNI